jgi:hypothetical protein
MAFKPKKTLLALAVAAASLACGVQAAELSFATATFSPDPLDQYADAYTHSNGDSGTMGLWQVSATNPSGSFLAFCIEPFVALPGAPGTGVMSATYTSGPNTAGALVQELYDRHYADVLTAADGTPAPVATVMGFQLALWSLANAEAVGNWNLVVSGQDAQDAANAMVASVITPDTVARKYTLTQWTSTSATNYQDVMQAAPVPEPEMYALMFAGLAMVGTIVRRRKAAFAA